MLWKLASKALAVLVIVAFAMSARAETASPQAFVDAIYKTYLGKDSKGVELRSDADVRRYFAPPLSDAMIKDFDDAKNEPPMLNGDPFIDAQDWDIANIKTAVKSTGAKTAVATVTFTIFMKGRTVTLDLVNTPAGWRIADIRGPSGSLRALYKLK